MISFYTQETSYNKNEKQILHNESINEDKQ